MAYQQYLKGRYSWYKRTEQDLRKGIEYFNRAIEEDPSYALAHDGLSDSYALLALRNSSTPGGFSSGQGGGPEGVGNRYSSARPRGRWPISDCMSGIGPDSTMNSDAR